MPRALLYYRYGRFWECFLAELGAEVVLSRKTDEEILARGLAAVSSEVCLPIKIAAGHLLELADSVDAIFFPRMNWLGDKLFACPKMIGIVDVAAMLVGNRVKLIAPIINGNFMSAHLKAGFEFTRDPFRVSQAWKKAKSELKNTSIRSDHAQGVRDSTVGVIGHFYNLGDDFIGRTIITTFRRCGYDIITKEEIPDDILSRDNGFAKNIRWIYERELYNAFEYLLNQVAGFCVVVSMGCGPDSLVAEFMREQAQKRSVPFLLLVIDEHTGEAGLVTRIEAFVELLKRRKMPRLARMTAL